MDNRSEWTYRRYVLESCKGVLTAWSRISYYWDEIREGVSAILCAIILLILPLLLPLAPLLGWLGMIRDKRDAKRRKEAVERMRRGIHANGGEQ